MEEDDDSYQLVLVFGDEVLHPYCTKAGSMMSWESELNVMYNADVTVGQLNLYEDEADIY